MAEKHELLEKLIVDLKMLKTPVWRRVATELSKTRKNQRSVNVSRIEKFAKEGLSIVVPGKVLSHGTLTKKVDVVAYAFSDTARKKITKAGGKAIELLAYAKKNSEGKKVQILG